MRKVLFIFGELSEDDLHWLVGSGTSTRVATGTAIIHEGRQLDRLYVILDGEFRITVAALRGEEVARLGCGEVVGDMALLDARPASATVTATLDSRVFAIPHDTLRSKLRSDNGFAARFYRALCLFLANRLTATTAMHAKGGKHSLAQNEREEDELSPELLESVSLAGARFDWFMRQLRTV